MKQILVIDDELGVREAFSEALAEIGYQVITAESGEEGLVKAQQEKPDLIFLDLRLPGIDGVETLHRLRQRYTDVPVYIVTGFRTEFMDRLRAAVRTGMKFNVFDKPLDGDQIRTIARGTLEGPQVL